MPDYWTHTVADAARFDYSDDIDYDLPDADDRAVPVVMTDAEWADAIARNPWGMP